MNLCQWAKYYGVVEKIRFLLTVEKFSIKHCNHCSLEIKGDSLWRIINPCSQRRITGAVLTKVSFTMRYKTNTKLMLPG